MSIFSGFFQRETKADGLEFKLKILVDAIKNTEGARDYADIKIIYDKARILLRNKKFLLHTVENVESRDLDVLNKDQKIEAFLRYLEEHKSRIYAIEKLNGYTANSERKVKFNKNIDKASAYLKLLAIAAMVTLILSYILFNILAATLYNPTVAIHIGRLILSVSLYTMIGAGVSSVLCYPIGRALHNGVQSHINASADRLNNEYNRIIISAPGYEDGKIMAPEGIRVDISNNYYEYKNDFEKRYESQILLTPN